MIFANFCAIFSFISAFLFHFGQNCPLTCVWLFRFEGLEDHGSDEVVEAMVAFGVTGFVERRLWIGVASQLRLESCAVIVDAGELPIGGRGTGFECAEQFGGLFGGLAEEL